MRLLNIQRAPVTLYAWSESWQIVHKLNVYKSSACRRSKTILRRSRVWKYNSLYLLPRDRHILDLGVFWGFTMDLKGLVPITGCYEQIHYIIDFTSVNSSLITLRFWESLSLLKQTRERSGRQLGNLKLIYLFFNGPFVFISLWRGRWTERMMKTRIEIFQTSCKTLFIPSDSVLSLP